MSLKKCEALPERCGCDLAALMDRQLISEHLFRESTRAKKLRRKEHAAAAKAATNGSAEQENGGGPTCEPHGDNMDAGAALGDKIAATGGESEPAHGSSRKTMSAAARSEAAADKWSDDGPQASEPATTAQLQRMDGDILFQLLQKSAVGRVSR